MLGIEIVKHMANKTAEFSTRYKLNFTLTGTCDDKIAEKFMEFDRAIFGKVKQITDKKCYTNSFMLDKSVPLEQKLALEAPYHELTNGGHVTYIEQEIEPLIQKMIECNIGCVETFL